MAGDPETDPVQLVLAHTPTFIAPPPPSLCLLTSLDLRLCSLSELPPGLASCIGQSYPGCSYMRGTLSNWMLRAGTAGLVRLDVGGNPIARLGGVEASARPILVMADTAGRCHALIDCCGHIAGPPQATNSFCQRLQPRPGVACGRASGTL